MIWGMPFIVFVWAHHSLVLTIISLITMIFIYCYIYFAVPDLQGGNYRK